MPFVQRDSNGKVIGKFANPQLGYAEEFLPPDHADLEDPPQLKIMGIEAAAPFTHRALRELVLALGELYPQSKSTLLYQRALAVEQQVAIERARL
jgi:hypothetical protein